MPWSVQSLKYKIQHCLGGKRGGNGSKTVKNKILLCGVSTLVWLIGRSLVDDVHVYSPHLCYWQCVKVVMWNHVYWHFFSYLINFKLSNSYQKSIWYTPLVNLASFTVSHWFSQMVIFSTERKLESNEFPHNIYIRTYSALSTTSLALRKWIFTLARVCTRFCWSVDLCLFNFKYWYI